MRRFGGVALSALLVACSPAPSATPGPTLSVLPAASLVPSPSASASTSSASPSAPPGTPDPSYLGSFAVLPATPPSGFEKKIECSGSIGQSDPVAIVWLKKPNGSPGEVVLRDYANVAKPRTACTFPQGFGFVVQLLDSRHVVIADSASGVEDLYAVVDLPEMRYRWFQLPKTNGWGSELIAVGPELDRVVWKSVHTHGTDIDTDTVYISTATRTSVLATLPDTNAGRCGEPTDSAQGRYTASGSYLYVLNQPTVTNASLLVVKGREIQLSIVPSDGTWKVENAPIMAIWSPVEPTLYWSKGGDVWRWTPESGQQKFIAGVTWFDPTISADGRYLAYSIPRADFKDDVYLVPLNADGPPTKIGEGPRAEPRFLNSTQLWYRSGGSGGCTGPSPAERIYNVNNGSEAGSVIYAVIAAWPATSANY